MTAHTYTTHTANTVHTTRPEVLLFNKLLSISRANLNFETVFELFTICKIELKHNGNVGNGREY